MYVVAAHLVETVTGNSLGSFLRERIWEPLGMSNTYYGMTDLIKHGRIADIAKGYHWNDEKYIEIPWLEQPEGSGAGEMISNVFDFAKFLKAMIRKAGPISEKGHEELVKPRIILEDDSPKPFRSPTLYALGWEIDTYHGELIISHDGSIGGFASRMLYIPRLEWGIITFGNTQTAYTAHDKICWDLIDDLLEIPGEKRFDWDEWLTKDMDEPDSKSIDELYPELPDKRLPLVLPLGEYTGSYQNKGYGGMTVKLKDGKLVADATDRTWQSELIFEHVSGAFFVVDILDIKTREIDRRKAEFGVGAQGKVMEMGIGFVDEMEDDLIWFLK